MIAMRSLKERFAVFGPGILMATAAIGGSHLVSSTQAGALFGTQLIWLIVVVNLLKYPFFKYAVEYTSQTAHTVVEGYYNNYRFGFKIFVLLNIFAAIVNTAGVLLLTASLLSYSLPFTIGIESLSFLLLTTCLAILLLGHYKILDITSKWVMIILTLSTVSALIIAMINGAAHPSPQTPISPYDLALLGFLVALMGWMPAPIEISAINSSWLKTKISKQTLSHQQIMLDFKVGYFVTLGLAVVFCLLGMLMQYGQNNPVELAGVAFSKQLIDMYANTIGEWARWLIAGVAFLCMFGTTITVLDGYSRVLSESLQLLRPSKTKKYYLGILLLQALLAMLVVLFFKADLKNMLMFAMSSAFVTTPVFAWMNLGLVKGEIFSRQSVVVKVLTTLGLIYLIGFALLFIFWRLAN
ncbi:divalent metal cation transporter [Pseudoalteromonas sp. McH1-7]|uniref:NRAMP family divalent metal transporter n=2 Tax=Pseudoalteromonas TaxID=53246 RepID=UPI0015901107|nr:MULTISPECIES: divalent metal cation transporter [Pseudoalteromonas]MDW7551394.1 divalent metal cation transporter [Pseudoalteromonas peptidolytica]NUZ12402.1 divalent metal cation transporter [Pseudoalteromonas sp. McH1-7]USD30838.1 divalent metal cation transporter [Pseudoalteromonas sp. SCSIO 43201]